MIAKHDPNCAVTRYGDIRSWCDCRPMKRVRKHNVNARMRDAIDADLSAGVSVADVAEKYSLAPVTIARIDSVRRKA